MSVTNVLSFYRGEDVKLTFQMSPVADVTGWLITWSLAVTPGTSILLTKTAVITSGPGGTFTVTLASADTSGLAVGKYSWDCRRVDPGSRATLASGTLDLRQEITA